MTRWLALGLALGLTSSAHAQNATTQNGTVVPLDVAQWARDRTLQDPGGLQGRTATGVGLNPFSITDNNGLALCAHDAPTIGPHNSLCLGHDSNGDALFSVDGGRFSFNFNGTVYPFPFAVGGIVGPSSTVVGDPACWNNTTGTLLASCMAGVKAFGAKCDSTTDDSAAIQAAVTATPLLSLPTGCVIKSTVTIPKGRTIVGTNNYSYGTASGGLPTIICRTTGTADCLVVGGSFVTLRDLSIDASAMPGGNSLTLNGIGQFVADNLAIWSSYNGVNVVGGNNMAFHHTIINEARGQYAVKFDSATASGDLLTISDSVVVCGYRTPASSTADGIIFDGNTHTLNLTNVPILRCNHGIKMQNSRGIATFPQFLFANNIQIEGATSSAFFASSGSSIWLTNSYIKNQPGTDQGNADGPNLVLACDPIAGVLCGSSPNGASAGFIMSNTQVFGNSTGPCATIDWQLTQITNSTFQICSLAAPHASPSLRYGTHVINSLLSNSLIVDGTGSYAVEVLNTGGPGSNIRLKDNILFGFTGPVNDPNNSTDGLGSSDQIFLNVTVGTTTASVLTGLKSVRTFVCNQSGGTGGGPFSTTITPPGTVSVTQTNAVAQAYNCIAGGW